MKKFFLSIITLTLIGTQIACSDDDTEDLTPTPTKETPTIETKPNIRVPAEWEPQVATWVQWANEYVEKQENETQAQADKRAEDVFTAYANFIKVIQIYQPVHLIIHPEEDEAETKTFLSGKGVDISEDKLIIHSVAVDNSWMRDNGPIYVTDGTNSWVQNWAFNGWGGGFEGGVWGYEPGSTTYVNDNKIPLMIAEYLNMEVLDCQNYVLEKGNIEVDGAGTLAINWSCQDHRNPGLTKEQHESILKNGLGVEKIIWADGYYEGDGTIGHIDGMARFIKENTIVVTQYDNSPTDILNVFANHCEDEGLTVIRFDGDPNWLVGEEFVVANGAEAGDDFKATLQEFFPNHTIHLIDASAIANQGGGIHCVTNDQPVLP